MTGSRGEDYVLAFNAGSSSLKFELFGLQPVWHSCLRSGVRDIDRPSCRLDVEGTEPVEVNAVSHAEAAAFILEGWSWQAIEASLNRESGLLGLSGASDDMRDLIELEDAGHPGARLALAAFVIGSASTSAATRPYSAVSMHSCSAAGSANPLLREPLAVEHIKPRLLGHWGTTPGLNFLYGHLNRAIVERDLSAIFVTGPGHGGPALITW